MALKKGYWYYTKATLPQRHSREKTVTNQEMDRENGLHVSTGMFDPQNLLTFKDFILGGTIWSALIGLVVYMMYTQVFNIIPYLVVTAVWAVTFIYVLLVVPIRYKNLTKKSKGNP